MKTDFNQYFGKHWNSFLIGLFPKILAFSIFSVFFGVLYLANFNYAQLDSALTLSFKEHYQNTFVQLMDHSITASESSTPVSSNLPSLAPVLTPLERAEKKVQNTDIIKALDSFQQTDHLPEIEDLNDGGITFEELTYDGGADIAAVAFTKRSNERRVKIKSHDEEDLMRGSYDYKIKRKRAIFINNTSGLLEKSNERYGHRNQSEIMSVIYSKQQLIEACYKKAAENYSISSGFIKVEFEISPRGFVIGSSIRILDSNLHDRILEQCIKNRIRRWRGFKKLDDSQGIAHVVHKFIFY